MSSDQIASVDGKIQCRFTRPIAVTKAIRNNPTYNFDLSSENYFLLIAEGPLTEGTVICIISTESYPLTLPVSDSGYTTSTE